MIRPSIFALIAFIGLLAVCLVGYGPSPRQSNKIDGYVVLVPKVLRSGQTASFSVSLFNGEDLTKGRVTVSLFGRDKSVASTVADIDGKGAVALDIPVALQGEFEVRVSGAGFSDSTPVEIQAGTLVFLETDKPIYKPGQTMLMRLVAINSELKPVQTEATVEIQDAKGVKAFKETVKTDEYGMATTRLPLSTVPNLGM